MSATALRYERKFVLPGRSPATALAWIRRHPAAFREVYPGRRVNNLYYDTAARRDYLDHVQGAPERGKLRVRWYGPPTGRIAQPRLEHKFRRGLLGGKQGHPLPPWELNGRLPPEAARVGSAPDLPPVLRRLLIERQPALLNGYQRRYFASADGRFRLTLDTDVRFATLTGADQRIRPLGPPLPLVILELKYPPAAAPEADRVTNAFPARLTRCSKYGLGLDRLAPW